MSATQHSRSRFATEPSFATFELPLQSGEMSNDDVFEDVIEQPEKDQANGIHLVQYLLLCSNPITSFMPIQYFTFLFW